MIGKAKVKEISVDQKAKKWIEQQRGLIAKPVGHIPIAFGQLVWGPLSTDRASAPKDDKDED